METRERLKNLIRQRCVLKGDFVLASGARSSVYFDCKRATLDPEGAGAALGPNAVRWLMSVRKADRWDTTQENAWAIIALTDWMAVTGELEGDYDWQVQLNGTTLGQGTVTPQNVQQVALLRADVKQLLLGQTNGLVLKRAASGGQSADHAGASPARSAAGISCVSAPARTGMPRLHGCWTTRWTASRTWR